MYKNSLRLQYAYGTVIVDFSFVRRGTQWSNCLSTGLHIKQFGFEPMVRVSALGCCLPKVNQDTLNKYLWKA